MPIIGIDHVMLATGDLDAARDAFQACLGRPVRPGSRHPGWGTANAVLRFADTYLELITVFDREAARSRPAGRRLADVIDAGGGWAAPVLAAADLDGTCRALRGRGIELAAPIDGESVRPDGRRRRWRIGAHGEEFRTGRLPSMIEYLDPWPEDDPDPAELTRNGIRGLAGVEIAVADLPSPDRRVRRPARHAAADRGPQRQLDAARRPPPAPGHARPVRRPGRRPPGTAGPGAVPGRPRRRGARALAARAGRLRAAVGRRRPRSRPGPRGRCPAAPGRRGPSDSPRSRRCPIVTTYTAPTASTPRSRFRTVATTVASNFIEYFDWLIFGLYAPILAQHFFPGGSPLTAVLGVFSAYAAGMFFRPLGGILASRLADRRGRRVALLLSITLMGGGSLVIGLLPAYASIGVAAPILLFLARAAQGLSAGGEWLSRRVVPDGAGAAQPALPVRQLLRGQLGRRRAGGRHAGARPRRVLRRGRHGAVGVAGPVPGRRGPVRRPAAVAPSSSPRASRSPGPAAPVPAPACAGCCASTPGRSGSPRCSWPSLTINTTTWTTVALALAQTRLHADPAVVYAAVSASIALAMLVQIPFGLLADRIGVLPMLTASLLGFAVAGPFALAAMAPSLGRLVLCMGTGLVLMACLTSVMPKLMAALFPVELRASGLGLPHGIANSLAGGLTPFIATYLAGHGRFGWYLGLLVVAAALAWVAGWIAVRRMSDESADPVADPAPRGELVAAARDA
nr:hypothetical protein GCM10020092_039990 [Actinoplanes digitatis]